MDSSSATAAEVSTVMTRRYSHRGPVCLQMGKPLSSKTLKTLYRANRNGMRWGAMAGECLISRATLWRALCGGNTRAGTLTRIEWFAAAWKRVDDERIARESRKRRAA